MYPLNNLSLRILFNKANEIINYVKNNRHVGFVLLGDSHLTCNKIESDKYILDSNGNQYKKILNHIVKNQKINPMFIIHGGDVVNAGDDTNSFEAFVATTKSILSKASIPIFVSVGNHDYDRYKVSIENFKSYIGPIRGVIEIPGTYIKYIYLNSHYSDAPLNLYRPKFSKKDIDLLLNESKIINNKYSYIIDFHTPLARSSSSLNFNDHELPSQETDKFFNSIKGLKVIGIFCHHKHVAYKTKINMHHSNKSTRYVVTGCGGNHNNNENFSYYYITIDTKKYKIINCKKYTVS